MEDFLVLYLFAKTVHILFFIAWMAGLLYLPRLFVYHTEVSSSSSTYRLFLIMEHRLFYWIMCPAVLITFLSGGTLLWVRGIPVLLSGWFHIKFLCTLILASLHVWMAFLHREFKNNNNQRTQRFYRIFNEIPFLLAMIIVFCAVFKVL